MTSDRNSALAFIAENHKAVVATIRRDGTPQLSNVSQALLDGAIEISTREPSAKVRNLKRDPRVTVAVQSDNWYRYLVVYGRAEIIGYPEAGPRLRQVYEAIAGKPHPNWDEFDQAMIEEQRVVLRIHFERTVG